MQSTLFRRSLFPLILAAAAATPALADPTPTPVPAPVATPASSSVSTLDTPQDPSYGIARGIPTYIQEWHVWWTFPYPDPDRPVGHGASNFMSFREPWRLDWNENGYPLPGLYNSANPDICRWQLRCLKATGVTSAAVMIHADMGTGLTFIQENDKDDFLNKLLDLAAEEKFPIFFMDEVAFRNDICKDPKIMTQRIIHFLKKYGSKPGFYKVDGKPVYYYQTYGYWPGADATHQMMTDVEAAVGPVYWMIFGDASQAGQVPEVKAIISGANMHRQNAATRAIDLTAQDPEQIFPIAHKFNKRVGDIHYPKFSGANHGMASARGVALYGEDGAFIEKTVAASMKAKPDVLMFSSWNDWQEGANFEPGWDFDGFKGDPYLYCRVLANMEGVKFVPPPYPPKTAVHPTIWEKLGYGDGAGPIIDIIRRTDERGGSIEVVVRDTMSPVKNLEVVRNGDLWWQAAQPGETAATGNLALASGKLEDAAPISSPAPPTLEIGNACMVDDSIITFKPTVSPSVVGTTPTVGAAYDFDPLKPIKAVWMSIPRQTPALLWEPAGGAQKTIEFPLFPFPRPDNIGANAWLGWQSRAAFAYAPVVISGTDASISVRARGSHLGIVSLLGAPRQDRCVTTAPIPNDKAGLNVTYYVPLTADELEHPGVRFIWLRAQDSAGNWGSAMLYPVPNFEEIPAKAVDYSDQTDFKGPDNAVFADALASPKNWKSLSGAKGGAEVMAQEVVRKLPYFSMGNGCFADLEKPVDGSFTAQMKMLPTDWRQGGVVLLTDETGTKGYGLRWDSSNPDQNNGTGHIAIWKLDPGKPITRYTFGSRIGSEGSSGHVIGQQPFADVMLVRDGARGRILLSVDGRVVTTATDATYSHFSRIYLLGNGVQIKELAVLPTGPATP